MEEETLAMVPPVHRGRIAEGPDGTATAQRRPPQDDVSTVTAIEAVRWRDRVRVRGKVRSIRVAPQRDVPTLECVVDDGTGTLLAVFLGRRELAGVNVGSRIELVGTAGVHQNRLAVLNPSYKILTTTTA
jgi:RecJ-like exonuclease